MNVAWIDLKKLDLMDYDAIFDDLQCNVSDKEKIDDLHSSNACSYGEHVSLMMQEQMFMNIQLQICLQKCLLCP